MIQERKRCDWAKSEIMIHYHDNEWGVPLHNDRALFEFLSLEGAQAGLSWEIILKKRENYRKAFDHFEPAIIAHYNLSTFNQLIDNAGIVRNRLKIASVINNAKAVLAIQQEFSSFDCYIWQFAPRKTPRAPETLADIPVSSKESHLMSKELKKRGFRFVGSTICYAFMQAVGMVNDHEKRCFRRDQVEVS